MSVKGWKKDWKEVLKKGLEKVAVNLLSDGMDVSKVVKLTGLTEDEVKKLKSQQDSNV